MTLETGVKELAEAVAADVKALASDKVDKEFGYSLIQEAEIDRLLTMATDATKNRADSANADKMHTHTAAQVSGLGTAATKNVGGGIDDLPDCRTYGVGESVLSTVSSSELNGKGLIAGRIDSSDPLNPLSSGGVSAIHSALTANFGAGIILEVEKNPRIYHYSLSVSGLSDLHMIYSTVNTTKNPDGTLKASSPAINLYTDKHDLHNEGQFGATPTVVRKSKGVYEITGTLGLRSEGWYLDTPHDRNGNKYFNIEWTQNITPEAVDGVVDEYRDDIVVTIETFERVWNKETGMFDNGAPIDINEPQDRFVQMRFNEIKVEREGLDDES